MCLPIYLGYCAELLREVLQHEIVDHLKGQSKTKAYYAMVDDI